LKRKAKPPSGVVDVAEADRHHLLLALLDNISDAIYFKDLESRFTLVSRSLVTRFNVNAIDDIIGKTDFDFYTEEHARQAYEDEQRLLRTREPIVDQEEKETWPDGSTTWVSTTKMPLYTTSGELIGTFGISRDITDRKRAQDDLARYKQSLELLVAERTKELRDANRKLNKEMHGRKRAERALLQTERLEAVSSMAGGVAVNFDHFIGVISGYASSIASNFIPGSRVHEEAMHILDATRQAGELTRRLTGVARVHGDDDDMNLEPVSLERVISDAVALLGDIFHEQNVDISVTSLDKMPFVEADSSQLLDTVMTLLLNAAEAMPDGGMIRIDASERVVRPHDASGQPAGRRRTFVVLRIRDSGVGISKETLPHIFEPFFTTKGSNKAYGLGLAFARSTIQSMGGWIRVRSQVDKGASFRVFLAKAKTVRHDRTEEAEATGTQTVLVVDDDASVVEVMEHALVNAGYSVLTATDPKAAAVEFRQQSSHIDVTVLDAIMTNGDVARLISEMRKLDPRAALVLTSGFSRDFVRGMVPPGRWVFVQKPFRDETLVKAVAEAIGVAHG